MNQSEGDIQIVYVHNPSRGHKLLPLLEGLTPTSLGTWRDLVSLVRSGDTKPRVVIIDTFGRWGAFGLFASFVLRSPLVIRLRGEFFREAWERLQGQNGIRRWFKYLSNVILARLCLKKAEMVMFNSRYLAQSMAPYVQRTLWTIVYNPHTEVGTPGSCCDNIEIPIHGFRLLTITNMNLYSKVEPIVNAIKDWIHPRLWEELDIHWVICGDGYHKSRIQDELRRSDVDHRVHILGWVEDVARFYNWCDVLVHLTKMDAFPNVTMEAMIYGKPIITNVDSCGTREQVYDGVNGFLVKDTETFIEALRIYANNSILRDRHGKAGKALVEKQFSVPVQRQYLRTALKELHGKSNEMKQRNR